MFWRLTLSVKMHAGLFWHFHTPLNYKFFNMHMWSFRICMCTWGISSEGCLFCRDCTEFDSREILRQAQCVAHNGHQPMCWPHLIMQKLAFNSEERLPSDSDVAFKIIKTLTCECMCACVCVCMRAHVWGEGVEVWKQQTHTHTQRKKEKKRKQNGVITVHPLTHSREVGDEGQHDDGHGSHEPFHGVVHCASFHSIHPKLQHHHSNSRQDRVGWKLTPALRASSQHGFAYKCLQILSLKILYSWVCGSYNSQLIRSPPKQPYSNIHLYTCT